MIGLQHRSCPRRDAGARRRTARARWTSWCVSDFFLSETAALADVVLPDRAVGRGGGHDDQPGGPGDAPPRGAARRRPACAPTWRSWPRWPSGSAAARLLQRRPHGVFDELRRASAGGMADYAGHQLRADRRRGRACSGPARRPSTPARRGCSPSASPTPDGRARFIAVEHRAHRPRSPTREYPLLLTTGRVAEALPVRHADPPGHVAVDGRSPSRAPRCTPTLARRHGIADGDSVRADAPAAARRSSGPGSPTTIRAGHGVRAVPLGRRAANALTNPALDPLSKMPAFKVCAVAVARLGPADHRTTEPSDEGRTPTCIHSQCSCRGSSRSRGRASTSPPCWTRR